MPLTSINIKDQARSTKIFQAVTHSRMALVQYSRVELGVIQHGGGYWLFLVRPQLEGEAPGYVEKHFVTEFHNTAHIGSNTKAKRSNETSSQ